MRSSPSPGNEPSNLGNLEHSADRSDKSGDKGKPHWLKWVGAAASAVTFFSIFVGGGWELYKYHHPDEATKAIRKMKELKVPFKEPKPFIQRKAVEEKIHGYLYKNPESYTTIIAGQRDNFSALLSLVQYMYQVCRLKMLFLKKYFKYLTLK